MPELPEVETIKEDLLTKIKGKEILDVSPLWEGIVKGINFADFKKAVISKKIVDINRRAKNLIIEIAQSPKPKAQSYLLIHLKMTGHLLVTSDQLSVDNEGRWLSGSKELTSDLQNQFIRIIFKLSNGLQLAFSDLRKFGYIKLVGQVELDKALSEYGPEPLEKDFTFDIFKERLAGKKGPIKKVLMDQGVIAGIGNIYADEILFEAKVHPMRPVNKLTEEDLKNIYKNIPVILNEARNLRGTSTSDFRDTAGKMGNYTSKRRVYQREGEPCPICGGKIERVKLGGRSAHFCPTCQR